MICITSYKATMHWCIHTMWLFSPQLAAILQAEVKSTLVHEVPHHWEATTSNCIVMPWSTILKLLLSKEGQQVVYKLKGSAIGRMKCPAVMVLCKSQRMCSWMALGTTNCWAISSPAGLSHKRYSTPSTSWRLSHWAQYALVHPPKEATSSQQGLSVPAFNHSITGLRSSSFCLACRIFTVSSDEGQVAGVQGHHAYRLWNVTMTGLQMGAVLAVSVKAWMTWHRHSHASSQADGPQWSHILERSPTILQPGPLVLENSEAIAKLNDEFLAIEVCMKPSNGHSLPAVLCTSHSSSSGRVQEPSWKMPLVSSVPLMDCDSTATIPVSISR